MSPTACPNRSTTEHGGFLQLEKPLTCENDSCLQISIFSHDTEKLAAAGSPCSRECGAHEVLLLSNNVVGKSRIHLKTFGITVGYD